ncbi:MAG: hypothetical protein AAF614_34010 [Chloroflexota bacterium]
MQKLLCIGQTKILCRTDYEALWPFIKQRYENFVAEERATPDVELVLEVVADKMIPEQLRGQDAVRFLPNSTIEMVRGNGYAIWDRRNHCCHIRQSEADFQPDIKHPEYLFGSIVRIMLSYLLLEQNGCLIHSTGLIRNGQGYLFVGKSGAGKSTVARISAPTTKILSDDLTLTQYRDGEMSVFGTPFWGDFKGDNVNNFGAPLQGIYFLRQADKNDVTQLAVGPAMRQLLGSVMYFGQEDRKTAVQILNIVKNLCTSIPCYTLDFVPDNSFWKLIH